jgi:hypothetical protein
VGALAYPGQRKLLVLEVLEAEALPVALPQQVILPLQHPLKVIEVQEQIVETHIHGAGITKGAVVVLVPLLLIKMGEQVYIIQYQVPR